jgi:transcriptional regulator with XRE-family HTH domain
MRPGFSASWASEEELHAAGAMLKTARESAGISTDDFGERTGFDDQFIESVEAGRNDQRTEVLGLMSRLKDHLISIGDMRFVGDIEAYQEKFRAG